MRGIAALALLCAVAAPPAMGQQPTPAPSQPKQHTVRKGDTLWDLAGFYLSDPFRWPLIYEANRNVVENPHWIYPKEKLVIVIPAVPADAAPAPIMVADAGRTVQHTRFYTPTRVDDGATLITAEVKALPLVQPLEWLAAPYIADRSKVQVVARVLKAADPRVEADKLDPFLHPRDKLFLSMVGTGLKKDDKLLAIRFERDLSGFGWIVVPQGILHVDSIGSKSASATVTSQFADLKVGDVAIPLPAIPPMPANHVTEVTGGPVGKVIDFLVEQPLYGTTDFAFVNVGAKDGLNLGDELLAYVPAHKPSSGGSEKLNEQAVALMRVVHVTDRTVTVRVTRLSSAALARDLPTRVVRVAQ